MESEIDLEALIEEIKSHIRSSNYLEKELILEEFESTLRIHLEYTESETRSFYLKDNQEIGANEGRNKSVYSQKEFSEFRGYQRYEQKSKERLAILLSIFDVFISPLILVNDIKAKMILNEISSVSFENDIQIQNTEMADIDLKAFQRIGEKLFPGLFELTDFTKR